MNQESRSIILNSKFLILISAGIIALILFFSLDMADQKNQEVLRVGKAEIFVEIADEPVEQYQGLSGRDPLCHDCGMLFIFDEPQIQNFSMRGMKFPLDFIFIGEGKVVETRENIPHPQAGEPYQHIQSQKPADMVLEVNAGFTAKNNIKTGSSISIDEQ